MFSFSCFDGSPQAAVFTMTHVFSFFILSRLIMILHFLPLTQFTIAKKAICDECDGSGARSDKDIVDCPHCDGKGIRLVRHQLAPGIFQQVNFSLFAADVDGKLEADCVVGL